MSKSLPRLFPGVLVLTLASLLMGGCATVQHRESRRSPLLAAVEGYVAALNRRDLLALTLYTTPDVEWYSVVGGELILEVSGRDALAKSLTQYFARNANARWTIKSAQVVANRVAVNEQSEWSEADRRQAHAGQSVYLGVYELSDGRIRRMTYFLDGG